MGYLALLLFILGLILLWQARRQQKASGLPGGKIVYADTTRWSKLEKPIYSSAIGLTGKPDYLVEQNGAVIPVEVKQAHNPAQEPFDTHIYQLGAYCILVSEIYEQRPPYGLLHYTNGVSSQTRAIPFTPQLEAAVHQVIAEIQACGRKNTPGRSHQSPGRCFRCGYRNTCDQALSGPANQI